MKYRIVEKPVAWSNGLKSIFYIQKKYKYIPFWMDLHNGELYNEWYLSLDEAKKVLETHKTVEKSSKIIHTIE